MQRLPKLLALPFFALSLLSAGIQAGPLQEFAGSWEGEFTTPFDPKPLKLRFGIEEAPDGTWRGGFEGDLLGTGLLRGERVEDGLRVECNLGGAPTSLVLRGGSEGTLRGTLMYSGLPIMVTYSRTAEGWADDLQFEVELPAERPTTVFLDGLPEHLLPQIESRVRGSLDSGNIVGLAMAVVIDGELADSRAWGWADVAQAKPVGETTLFRWGSISKPVTAVAAGKLALAGDLDLDLDVRKYVPEYPEKKHTVTTRLLLGHLGGLAHYGHFPPVVRVDYGVPFPFRDAVRAIDMFREAPLINEPGSSYSYSTHGYALAGAVLDRVDERMTYLDQVRLLVSEPLAMDSFAPDDPSAPDAARTTGYRLTQDGRVFDAGDSNVAWKLAGGGFQSTVADLARFGAGMCDDYFVDEELRELLWTRQTTNAGQRTGYGLGFNISSRDGILLVSHGGAQRRTRTFLLVAPDAQIAVAIMCNTEGSNLAGIGQAVMRLLIKG